MAELAALGVASYILQVVDFGSRVIKTTYILISASQDALREEIHLETLVREQDGIAKRLNSSLGCRPILTANEQAVVSLSGEVRKETEDLLQLLSQFKTTSVDQSCFKRSFHCAKTAFRIHRKREEIEDRRKKLQLVNGQLAIALLSVQRDQHEGTSKELQRLNKDVHSGTKDILAAVLALRDELRTIFDKHEEKRQAALRAVVSSLGFADLQSRQSSIHDAYSDTYHWALTEDARGLATWLRTDSDIYWVSGKAGSGKSTFMKFLGNDQRTHDLLNQWSGDHRRLIVVNCYFWYLGSELQKSIDGLLRIILYQILSSYPSVVELLFPARCILAKTGCTETQASWTRSELQTALERIGRVMSETFLGCRPPSFCLFIDGLDEYSGSYSELLTSLYSLVQNGNTKLCVSSRPWNVFVNAFETRTLQLCLHEFTDSDIRLYVESNLNVRVASSSMDSHMACIANDIVTRAEGVFLWVYLVVQSVKRGIEEGDESSVLRERVLDFPTDLESFFDTILDRIDGFHEDQTAQALMLAYLYAEGHDVAAERSSYLDFELLGRQRVGLHDTGYLWTALPQKIDSEEYLNLAERTQRFLSATCKDLLVIKLPRGKVEVQACAEDPSRSKVQSLHRTVFEYLKSSGRMRDLQRKCPPCFNDGSVFHILNMGKLKLSLDRQAIPSSRYFRLQTSFSLDHAWQGLDVRFIDEIQKCQPWHQSNISLSIAAAYIAFEQFSTFFDIFGLPIPYQLHQTNDLNMPRPRIRDASALKPLLTASLGMSECRMFSPDNINVFVLTEILVAYGSALPSSCGVISRFLRSALPPLLKACDTASRHVEAWDQFFRSSSMAQMYDVVQTMGHVFKTETDGRVTMKCPVSEDMSRHAQVVWNFLTTQSDHWETPYLRLLSLDSESYEDTVLRFWNNSSTGARTGATIGDDWAPQSLDPDPGGLLAFNLYATTQDNLELQRFVLQMNRLQEARVITPVGYKRKRPPEEEIEG